LGNHVRVIKQHMGGGFGSKQIAWKHTVIAALLAKQAGRPVQLVLNREAENLAVGNRNATRQYVRLGAKRDGVLTGISARIKQRVGAYMVGGEASNVSGPYQRLYRCRNARTEQRGVYTNTGPAVAFRAPGSVEGAFALESAMDERARALQLDPLDLRLRNYASICACTLVRSFSKGGSDVGVTVEAVITHIAPYMIIGHSARGPNPEDKSVRTFGAHCIEVDVETGEVTVLRVIASHDCGRIINPTMVDSQVIGAVTQGLGFALTEERVVNTASGVVLNANLEEYKVPRGTRRTGMRPFDYMNPATVDEAVALLGQNEHDRKQGMRPLAGVQPLAGGTDLLTLM
jgi:CO/xanthine dehydrogenase Mo-binding subunit